MLVVLIALKVEKNQVMILNQKLQIKLLIVFIIQNIPDIYFLKINLGIYLSILSKSEIISPNKN
jgi:hypothetical protein